MCFLPVGHSMQFKDLFDAANVCTHYRIAGASPRSNNKEFLLLSRWVPYCTCFVTSSLTPGSKVERLSDGQLWLMQVVLVHIR